MDGYILNNRLQCPNLKRDLHFITRPLSREEEDYPVAFIVTVHKELELFVRLLRAIYMPQNVYCIHVDAKAPLAYQAAVRKLVSCFENTFLSSHSETVTYAGFSRLQADLNCMKDLAKSKIRWRKVINLCGQDFPIKSNLELVRYMQSKEWRDRNMTPGVKQPVYMRHRTQLQHREIKGSHVVLKGLGLKKGPPPHNLQVYFGTAYYALTRAFVDFVLKSPVAHDLLEWSKDTFSPDEHYWVTLNHIKGKLPVSNGLKVSLKPSHRSTGTLGKCHIKCDSQCKIEMMFLCNTTNLKRWHYCLFDILFHPTHTEQRKTTALVTVISYT